MGWGGLRTPNVELIEVRLTESRFNCHLVMTHPFGGGMVLILVFGFGEGHFRLRVKIPMKFHIHQILVHLFVLLHLPKLRCKRRYLRGHV